MMEAPGWVDGARKSVSTVHALRAPRGGSRPGDLGEVSPERTTLRGERQLPGGEGLRGGRGPPAAAAGPFPKKSWVRAFMHRVPGQRISFRSRGVPGSEGMSLSPRGYLAPRAAPASWVGEGLELPLRPAVGTVGTGPTLRPRKRQGRSQHHDRGRICRSLQREVVEECRGSLLRMTWGCKETARLA